MSEKVESRRLINALDNEGDGFLELKKVSQDVKLPLSRDDKNLIIDLLTFTIDNDGRGMAAIQLGEAKNIFVMEKPTGSGRLQVVVNPVVHSVSGKRNRVEACFSFPGLQVVVQRPSDIVVSYYDENGELTENERLSGNTGQTFLHEYCHLLGLTMMDESKYGRPLGRA